MLTGADRELEYGINQVVSQCYTLLQSICGHIFTQEPLESIWRVSCSL